MALIFEVESYGDSLWVQSANELDPENSTVYISASDTDSCAGAYLTPAQVDALITALRPYGTGSGQAAETLKRVTDLYWLLDSEVADQQAEGEFDSGMCAEHATIRRCLAKALGLPQPAN